ncbi:hypothetical protein LXA43DRAFT_513251 [Ganoderma leucocontextum]|nr:hypothetical protein LXA43DRAFT_513251 [Ganoderma leucocontextum]
MTTPSDPEKAEEFQALLAELPSNDSASASDVPKNDKKRRFWHFLLYSLTCALFALGILSRSTGFNRPGCRSIGQDQARYSTTQCLDSVNFTTITTPQGEGSPYRAHTSISLPVFAKELSFVARGDLSYGTFQISQSGDAGSEAVVDIDVSYHQPEVLGNATMCRLHPSRGKWGFGIFVGPHPNWSSAEIVQKLRVDINVRLPANIDTGKPVRVQGLRTYLPHYLHAIQDLSQSVDFGKVQLTSHDGGIAAESLRADAIKIESRIGPITGTYNATRVLVLDTANAPIMVRANLLGGDDHVVRLFIKTSNGLIDSQVGLYSNASDATGGTFVVSARTANSPLKLTFVDAPVDSALHATMGTSNSPAQVTLHETYEGSFSLLSSTFFRPAVEWDKDPEDPAGRGRERTVKVNAVKDSLVTGDVFWGEKEAKEKGSVSVETSNSPLRLIL